MRRAVLVTCLLSCFFGVGWGLTGYAQSEDQTQAQSSSDVIDAAHIPLADPAANNPVEIVAPPRLAAIPAVIKSVVPTPEIKATSWMLIDFESGWILGSENSDTRIEPASLTKLMTSFLVFEALVKGEIKLTDQVYVSKKAWKTGGSRMFIQVDTRVDVESLLKGLIIQSGNDAAVALGEYLGGSEEGFAVRMNHKAAELGMVNSHFTNSNGLPDPEHYSTAEDMVILGRALIRNFPDLFSLYSTREYTYNNITQKNRNALLYRDPSVDGLKTGYTKAAGYCLIGTAKRDDMRLMAIVTGAESRKARADAVQSLLQYGYAAYDGLLLYKPGDQVTSVPLWMGTQSDAGLTVNRHLGLIFPKGQRDKLSAALDIPQSLEDRLRIKKMSDRSWSSTMASHLWINACLCRRPMPRGRGGRNSSIQSSVFSSGPLGTSR